MAALKHWGTPQLIVLTRASPEEAVLECCKNGGSLDIDEVFANCAIKGTCTDGSGNTVACCVGQCSSQPDS